MPRRWRSYPSREIPPTLQADQERVDRCAYELLLAMQLQVEATREHHNSLQRATRNVCEARMQDMAKELAKLRRANKAWAELATSKGWIEP